MFQLILQKYVLAIVYLHQLKSKPLNTLFVAQKIISLDEVDSTNNYTIERIGQNDIVEGNVVSADFQKSGKGQRNKSWESYPGKNLLFSVALHPTFLNITKQFYLAKIAALAIVKVLEKAGIKDVSVKWPNDVFVGDKKIAGILIETLIRNTGIEWAIVGVGLNVNQRYFPEFNFPATSMRNKTNRSFERSDVLSDFAEFFENYYLQLRNKGFEAIDQSYHDYLYMKNVPQLYELATGGKEELVLEGVDVTGKARLRNANKLSLLFNQSEVKLTRNFPVNYRLTY